MLFNSIEFLFFFSIVFFLYWFVFSKNLKIQNLLILLFSYLFYAWWDWKFLILIFISSISDYYIGLFIYNSNSKKIKATALKLSLFINIGILLIFKYFNFFIENFILVLDTLEINYNITLLNIILPIGISFYTFQTLSYSIDIYNGKIKATKDYLAFFSFVAFFPQLVAGPIERAKNLLPQFLNERKFEYQFAVSGCRLILFGLFKKMVVADNLAVLVDTVYLNPSDFLGFPSLLATIFFAFQIYCDFSGYSDIAIGLSRLLGFRLMTNFKTPYFSKNLTSFWRNWHISLSSWFKDYVYIPLGGKKKSKKKTYLNILITFLLSGLWHGANWTFIIWGSVHGFGLILEKMFFLVKKKQIKNSFTINSLRIFVTFSFICLSWIFFRSETISDAYLILTNLFSDILFYSDYQIMSLKFRGLGLELSDLVFCVFLIFGLLIGELCSKSIRIIRKFNSNKPFRLFFYYLTIVLILVWGSENSSNNFIYFQF